jgi:exodeoxyribonuclease-3
MIKLATWNVNSLGVRLPQVLEWLSLDPSGLGESGVDLLAIQETKTTDDKFPLKELESSHFHVAFHGQKTYNGVALISKFPLENIVKNIPGFEDEMARVISATVNGVRVIGAYFPNGQDPQSDKFQYKMRWLTALHDWIKSELIQYPKMILMGDFNITFDARDVWDPVKLEGTIHCTPEERAHLFALIELGFTDAFREFDAEEKKYSWWDYREFAFKRNRGLRIDHVLVSNALKPELTGCFIDKGPRKNERPSDHTPVVVCLK